MNPVLGRYHNFMIPTGFGFHKKQFIKRVQFSLFFSLEFICQTRASIFFIYYYYYFLNWFSICQFSKFLRTASFPLIGFFFKFQKMKIIYSLISFLLFFLLMRNYKQFFANNILTLNNILFIEGFNNFILFKLQSYSKISWSTQFVSNLTKGCKCSWHFTNIGCKDFLSYSKQEQHLAPFQQMRILYENS
jgi:hypothetical protein